MKKVIVVMGLTAALSVQALDTHGSLRFMADDRALTLGRVEAFAIVSHDRWWVTGLVWRDFTPSGDAAAWLHQGTVGFSPTRWSSVLVQREQLKFLGTTYRVGVEVKF